MDLEKILRDAADRDDFSFPEDRPDHADACAAIDKIVNAFGESPSCDEAQAIRAKIPVLFGDGMRGGLSFLHLDIHAALVDDPGMTNTQLSKHIGADSSVVRRRLLTLEQHGMVYSRHQGIHRVWFAAKEDQ